MAKKKIELPELPSVCHGCGGRGWVDSGIHGAQKCPVCLGKGVVERDQFEKDQWYIWKLTTYLIPDPIFEKKTGFPDKQKRRWKKK